MPLSMTGFAAAKGQGLSHVWTWDIRSVNGKGLDLRLRVPDWIEGLEAGLRAALGQAVQRGNVSLTLKIAREGGEAETALRVNHGVLGAVLLALREVEDSAMGMGVTLGQATAADVLAVRGVMDLAASEVDTAPLRAALLAELPELLVDFNAVRASEGLALAGVLAAQLDRVDAGLIAAASEVEARRALAEPALRDAVARVLREGIDAGRLAQELALLAVKQDVTEELDRLGAHVAAARSLLADPGPVGRKFDFLTQEFMREANTLCSKSQSAALTRVGLDLKVVIDQMREQVQNVE